MSETPHGIEITRVSEVSIIDADDSVETCIDDRKTVSTLHFISDRSKPLKDLREGKFQEIIDQQKVKRRQANEHGL